VAPQDPETSQARPGQKQQVHALIATVCSRKHLARAWAKVQKTRGRAGLDEGPIAQFEARQECSVDRLHHKRRAGTYRPPPLKRVEIPTSEGGVRTRGLPAGLERVCQPALVQRMEPIVEPTCLDSACG
jgi:RNA-directed DNA polymerase